MSREKDLKEPTQDRVYVDTSAYLLILLGEKDAQAFQRKLRNKVLCSSSLLFIEAERTLVRLVREQSLQQPVFEKAFDKLKENVDLFLIRDLTLDLCLNFDFPMVRTPRSSDLVHLRTAKWFLQNGGLSAFVSADRAQTRSALEMGLPVWV